MMMCARGPPAGPRREVANPCTQLTRICPAGRSRDHGEARARGRHAARATCACTQQPYVGGSRSALEGAQSPLFVLCEIFLREAQYDAHI